MIVRRFTVAFFQIFTKGLVVVLAEIGSPRQGQGEGQAKAAQHSGVAVARPPGAPVHLHVRRAVCAPANRSPC